jgi:hypothetical protein
MGDQLRINAVEMTRQIRDAHYADLKDRTPEERIEFYRKKARALHAELGITEELPDIPDAASSHAERRR